MRRKNLLAAGMLTVLLATSACGTVTGAPNSFTRTSGSAGAGVEASSITQSDKSSAEVGDSQQGAAPKTEVAATAAKAEAAASAAQKSGEQALAASPVPAAVPVPAVAPAVVAKAPKPAAGAKLASAPVQPASSSENIVNTAYTTAYTWHDNTPAGSAVISYPVLHQTAGGTGTYEDPITIAVGHSLATGADVLDFPAGTKIYLPDVRRYFIVEDTCGDGNDPQAGPCHQGANANGTNSTIWIDMWIGGQSMNAGDASNCASTVTNVNTAVFNPASNYVVAPGAGVIHDGKCDAGYGNTLVKQ